MLETWTVKFVSGVIVIEKVLAGHVRIPLMEDAVILPLTLYALSRALTEAEGEISRIATIPYAGETLCP